MIESKEGRVLEALMRNGRASISEVADDTGMSEPTVRKYVRRLEESETILGYSAEVNPKKVGDRMVALVGVNASSDSFLEVAEALKEVEEVSKLYTSSGDHDLMAEVVTDGNASLHDVVSEEITSLEGVEECHPAVLIERLK